MSDFPDEYNLPALREELEITQGAPFVDGGPSWLIFDPVRYRFFQIGQRAVELLSLWSAGSVGALRRRMLTQRGAEVEVEEVSALLKFLFANSLTESPSAPGIKGYLDQDAAQQRQSIVQKFMQNYLFFRVPLFRPQAFLSATMPLVAPLLTRGFAIVIVLATLLGLYLVSRQWDVFIGQFPNFLSLEGIAAYVLSLIFVKMAHELGHAYFATKYGCRVPTMGVAFLLMMPLLYTDVTDAWRLRKRRERMFVDAGGVLVELALAGVATLIWAFLADGVMRDVVFVVATTSWVLSLFLNLNPFMRFDGYFFLADLLGVQNLGPRTTALCKWRLREGLFGIGHRPPEQFAPRLRRFLYVYGVATWIYRLFLFLGIALLVYSFAFKVLGVILFVLEIGVLLVRPILIEMKEWWGMRSSIIRSRRFYVTLGVLALIIAACVYPWRSTVKVPAVLEIADQRHIYAEQPGRLVQISGQLGDKVNEGDVLFVLASPELELQVELTRRRIALLELRLGRRGADQQDLAESGVLTRELESERQNLANHLLARQQLRITAGMSGEIVERDPNLTPGRWVATSDLLALVAGEGPSQARGYVGEDDRRLFDAGAVAVFVPDDPAIPSQQARIAEIGGFGVTRIDIPYLASVNGGPVEVDQSEAKALKPANAQFAVLADIDMPDAVDGKVVRGVLRVKGERESLVSRAARQVMRVLVREAGV